MFDCVWQPEESNMPPRQQQEQQKPNFSILGAVITEQFQCVDKMNNEDVCYILDQILEDEFGEEMPYKGDALTLTEQHKQSSKDEPYGPGVHNMRNSFKDNNPESEPQTSQEKVAFDELNDKIKRSLDIILAYAAFEKKFRDPNIVKKQLKINHEKEKFLIEKEKKKAVPGEYEKKDLHKITKRKVNLRGKKTMKVVTFIKEPPATCDFERVSSEQLFFLPNVQDDTESDLINKVITVARPVGQREKVITNDTNMDKTTAMTILRDIMKPTAWYESSATSMGMLIGPPEPTITTPIRTMVWYQTTTDTTMDFESSTTDCFGRTAPLLTATFDNPKYIAPSTNTAIYGNKVTPMAATMSTAEPKGTTAAKPSTLIGKPMTMGSNITTAIHMGTSKIAVKSKTPLTMMTNKPMCSMYSNTHSCIASAMPKAMKRKLQVATTTGTTMTTGATKAMNNTPKKGITKAMN